VKYHIQIVSLTLISKGRPTVGSGNNKPNSDKNTLNLTKELKEMIEPAHFSESKLIGIYHTNR